MIAVALKTIGRKLTRCDQCSTGEGITEYILPYSSRAIPSVSAMGKQRGRGGDAGGRYRDLCPACVALIRCLPGQYVTKETELPTSDFSSLERAPLEVS